MNLLIRSAIVIDKKSEFHNDKVDILIKNGIISNIARSIKNSNNYKELKFDNLHVSVGWFDYSISCGQPGYEERENMKNTLDVASKSGFTCIGIQPNTDPVIDKRSEIEYIKLLSANNIVTAHPIGSLTKKSEGNKLSEIFDMGEGGAIAFGDYKRSLKNPNILKLALQYSNNTDYPIMSFPNTMDISENGVINENITSTILGLNPIPSFSEHLNIQRDLTILEYTGGKLHIPTISTEKSCELIRNAKKRGLNISCSTAIHNLFFDDQYLSGYNTNFKVLPPLRSIADKESLKIAVKDGTIDLVTCDHNPLNIELKDLEFENASFGTIGLESCFGALNKLFSTKSAIQILTKGRSIFSLNSPTISIGESADITLFNPNYDYIFSENEIFSKSKNSIFKNTKLKGKVYGIISNNKLKLNV